MTLTNVFNVPVLFKVLIKSDEIAQAKIVEVSPKSGLLAPAKSQQVMVFAVASEDSSALEDFDNWLPVVGKLLVQWRPAGEKVDLADCSGDKCALLWDSGDELSQKPQSQEINVFMNVVFSDFAHSSPVPQARKLGSSFSASSPKSATCLMDKSEAANVVNSIQDLVAMNETLKSQLSEMEFRRQSEMELLSVAKKEAEDAKMTSQLASHLVRQVEDLKVTKESLEKEMKSLQLRDIEKKEHLAEKDIKLQALQMESDRLARENLKLKGSSDLCHSDKQGFQDEAQEMLFKRSSSPKMFDAPNYSYYPSAWNDVAQPHAKYFSTNDNCKDNGKKTSSNDKTEKKIDCTNQWTCDDESLLFFLKSMTMLFGGLTFLAAVNILVTDFAE